MCQQRSPFCDQLGVGSQITVRIWKILDPPPQKSGEGPQEFNNVVWNDVMSGDRRRKGRVGRFGNGPDLWERTCEQWHKPGIAFDSAGLGPFQQIGQAGGEHHLIADSLLGE
jgi:hypothetical protein